MSVLDAALDAVAAGWSPLHLAAGTKSPPPTGHTGHVGQYVTAENLGRWDWSGNMAIRLPPDVVGIDVDAYAGGDVSLDELIADYGPLPPTVYSTSRCDGSGIRLYRVPVGTLLRTDPATGVDMIQAHHRYVMVPPSIHPDLGLPYRLIDEQSGETLDRLPGPGDFPDLPWSWIEGLRGHKSTVGEPATPDAARRFLDEHDGGTRLGLLDAAMGKLDGVTAGGRHDALITAACWLAREVAAGWYPGEVAFGRLRAWWVGAVDEDRAAGGEYGAAVLWGIGQALADPDRVDAKRVTSANGTGGAKRRLTLTPASAIQPRPVKWLWQDRVALGTLALLGGREGIGKSLVGYQLTADITRGRLPGEHHGTPQAVIVCATEDSWAHTIVPRLMAAGAALDLVYRVDVATVEGVTGTLTLPADLDELRAAVEQVGAVAIVLDPLLSRLSIALDSHKDAEVRQALEPLVAIADRTGAAVVGLIHVNKSTSTDPLTMLMASRAFAAVARAVLFVAVDPEDATGQRRYIGQPKNNLGRTDHPLQVFTIEAVHVADTPEGPVFAPKLVPCGEDPRSIAEVLNTKVEPSNERTETDGCAAWLADFLSIHQVARSQDVKAEARREGHSVRTVERARVRIGAGVTNRGFPRRTWWSDPGITPDRAAQLIDQADADAPVAPTPLESTNHGATGTTGMTALPVVPVTPVKPLL